jgi:hypothetical protein
LELRLRRDKRGFGRVWLQPYQMRLGINGLQPLRDL